MILRATIVGILVALGSGTTSFAGGIVKTPETVNIPEYRPTDEELAAHRLVVKLIANSEVETISIDPQPIPQSREKVRIVGNSYLPRPEDEITLLGEPDAQPNEQLTVATTMSTTSRIVASSY